MEYELNEQGKGKCPECLGWVDVEELDTFGGLCEECSWALSGD